METINIFRSMEVRAMFEYKVFVRNGVEHIGFRQEGGRAKNESFALGQSLLDFLDVDLDKYYKPFMLMGEHLARLHELPAGQDVSYFEQELKKLAREHVYFQFVRLDWLERFEDYRQEKEGWQKRLSYRELSRMPMQVGILQNQVKRLIDEALEITTYRPQDLRESRSALMRVKRYYETPQLGPCFSFGRIKTEFSCAHGMYGDVLIAHTLEDIPSFLLREFIKANNYYKMCLHCGEFFVPDHGNAEYCTRPVADSNKNCRDIGATKNYRDRLREDPVQRVYSRAYKTRFARIKYKTMTREDFQAWSVEAREKRDKVLRGELALEDFEAWAQGN